MQLIALQVSVIVNNFVDTLQSGLYFFTGHYRTVVIEASIMTFKIDSNELTSRACSYLFQICSESLESQGKITIGEKGVYRTSDIQFSTHVLLMLKGGGLINREVPNVMRKRFMGTAYSELLEICPKLSQYERLDATAHFVKGHLQHIEIVTK